MNPFVDGELDGFVLLLDGANVVFILVLLLLAAISISSISRTTINLPQAYNKHDVFVSSFVVNRPQLPSRNNGSPRDDVGSGND